ncbi:MAG: hypothetical protein ABW025_14700, partial [Cellulomonas sp.]
MRGRAAVLLALVPAVLGLLGAVVLLASGRSLRVVVGTPLPVALAVPGLLLTAALLLALAAARDRRRAVTAAADA